MELSLILDNFYPKIGGMSIQNQEMARFLHKAGNTVRVFPLLGDARVDYGDFSYPVQPICITQFFPENYGQFNLHSIAREINKTLKGLLRMEQIGRCSIIHTDLYASGILGSIIKKMKKKRMLIYFGGNIFRNEEFSGKGEDKYHRYKGLVYTIGAKIALSIADKIIVNGEDIASELVSHGIPFEKIRVIYIGVDETLFRPDVNTRAIEEYFSGKNVSIPKGRKIVMFCGRLVNANGPFDFLEVVDNLASGVIGLIIGDGHLKKELEEKAKSIRNKVIFAGSVKHELIPAVLRFADLCIYPFTKIGGVSQVVLEAMACGKCVITTSAGAMGKVIKNGYNGFIAGVGDIRKITHCADKVLKNDSLLDRIGVRARQDILEKWCWASRISEYQRVCEEMLREN